MRIGLFSMGIQRFSQHTLINKEVKILIDGLHAVTSASNSKNNYKRCASSSATSHAKYTGVNTTVQITSVNFTENN